MTRLTFVCAAAVCSLATMLRAADAEDSPGAKLDPARVVLHVYGTAMTAAEIGLDDLIEFDVKSARSEKMKWSLTRRIYQAVSEPIVKRFAADHRTEPTPADIADFRRAFAKTYTDRAADDRARAAEFRRKLADPKLMAPPELLADPKFLAQLKSVAEQNIEISEKSAAEQDARSKIEVPADYLTVLYDSFQIERELRRTYGGRVFLAESVSLAHDRRVALDARRKLCEEVEKAGDLKFEDPRVRSFFYDYFAPAHHTLSFDPKSLESAYWTPEPSKQE